MRRGRRRRRPLGRITVTLTLLLLGAAGFADPAQGQEGALARPLTGRSEARTPPDSAWRRLAAPVQLPAGAIVRTAATGTASLLYADSVEVLVRPATTVRVGGAEGGLVSVLLGRIRVRAERLLRSSTELELRTPTAVAAIRGTELTIDVDRASTTEVFVHEGVVAVSNVQLPAQVVLVQAGQMTRVEPFLPPTPPRPFQGEELDRTGGLDALELAEDPALEAAQEPAAERWLAFRVPTLDVERSAAYLAETQETRSTTLLSGGGWTRTDRTEQGGEPREERWEGHDLFGRHVTLLPITSRLSLGVLAAGRDTRDRRPATEATGLAGGQSTMTSRVGTLRALASYRLGGAAAGVGLGMRRSEIDAATSAAGFSARTRSENDILRAEAGLLWAGAGGSFAASVTHEDLGSTTRGDDGGEMRVDGRDDVARLIYRRSGRGTSWAGLLEARLTETAETVAADGAPVYDEDRTVAAVRAGPSLGVSPLPDLLFGLDATAGLSRETAVQRLPSGGVREDEDDVRAFATLHSGAQLLLRSRWLITLDALYLVERTSKEFRYPDSAAPARSEVRWLDRVTTGFGIGWLGHGILIEYLVQSPAAAGRPLVHSIVLGWNP